MLQGCISKAKKLPKLSPETKADIEAFEAKLAATAVEKQEERATADAALQQAAGPGESSMSKFHAQVKCVRSWHKPSVPLPV